MQKLTIEIEGLQKPLDNQQIADILQGLSDNFYNYPTVNAKRVLYHNNEDGIQFVRLETYLT